MLLFFLVSGVNCAHAQVPAPIKQRTFSLTAGGLGSVFQPDYAGGGVPGASPTDLAGPGAFVDLHFTNWIQIEAEGRWLRFNQYHNINEDNYLIGYRHPIRALRFWNITPYGKILVGFARMNFEYNTAYGRFADIAYGGGLEMHTKGRFVIRPVDFEYQQWPNWFNGGTLHPYGFSFGIGYRILGR
jgi:hypothetical protein